MEAPYNIVNFRREKCVRCPTPCEFQKNVPYRTEGDNACPLGKWMVYKIYPKAQMFKGLGDVVAAIAQPIAGAIDALSGGKTKIRKCGACAKRKEQLNQLLPFGK